MNTDNNSPTRVVGLYNWHDGGYCVLEDGVVSEHVEFERYTRLKECGGDSLDYLQRIYLKPKDLDIKDIDHWVSPCPDWNLSKGGEDTFSTHETLDRSKIHFYSHHLCHAAHAYFSSSYEDALVLTIDSAGLDEDGRGYSTTAYVCQGSDMQRVTSIPEEVFSLGNIWTRLTRFVFKLSAGYPRGCQAGSVMAMAALGDPDKFYQDILRMTKEDFKWIRFTPPGMVKGRVLRDDEEEVIHPFLDKFRKIAEKDEQDKFNLAASLQKVTETVLFDLLGQVFDFCSKNGFKTKNLCLVGGVSLNSVVTGKISKNLSQWGLENIFIPPVPYDGGLNIGACQYHWHSVMGMPRYTNKFVSPYLGEQYTESAVKESIAERIDQLNIIYKTSLKKCAQLLREGKIVSIFQGRSESGRRALGNRSILADPTLKGMKDLINKKVKHRQWYRPFAPSVLEEYGADWFKGFFPSPYMSFVFDVKDDKKGIAAAIEHFDGTARLQSVSKDQNTDYYNLIHEFYELSGVPIVLNTSFNDREPICETPLHAIDCFLRTDIDYLYFPEYKIMLEKKQ